MINKHKFTNCERLQGIRAVATCHQSFSKSLILYIFFCDFLGYNDPFVFFWNFIADKCFIHWRSQFPNPPTIKYMQSYLNMIGFNKFYSMEVSTLCNSQGSQIFLGLIDRSMSQPECFLPCESSSETINSTTTQSSL